MYTIPIDDIHYHTNLFSNEELAWTDAIYSDTVKKYPDLRGIVQSAVSPLNLTKTGIDDFMRNVMLAFCHTIQRDYPVNTRDQLCKTLRKWIPLLLPSIAANNQICRPSHCVQYEPMTVATIATSNFLNNRTIHSKYAELPDGSFENYILWEYINFARAIRSSTPMFTTGDDVHGVGTYRGILEILAKIILADKFQEEYVMFKNFNAFLQYQKSSNTPLPEEMITYLKACPEYKNNRESFLAYGWARDLDGNRILTMKSLLQTAFPNQDYLLQWIQVSSEFIHEDYVAVGYDFPLMRREILKGYFTMYKTVIENLKPFCTKEERKQTGYSALKTLFNNISGMYPAQKGD